MQIMVRPLMAGAAIAALVALGPSSLMAQQKQERQNSVDEPVKGSNTTEKVKPEDVHQTQPGDQYQPEHNILSEIPTEQPGAKPGVPQLSQAEFEKAKKIYFSRLIPGICFSKSSELFMLLIPLFFQPFLIPGICLLGLLTQEV